MKSLLILISLMAAATLNGQDVRDPVYENTLLWEVTGPSLTKPSYLYGTHHICCDTSVKLDPVILEKLYSSKIFYLETLATKGTVDSMKLLSRTNSGMREFLGKNNYKAVKSFLERYYDRVPDNWLDTLSTQELLTHLRNAQLRCRVIAYDDSLYTLARQHNLDLRQLESIEEGKAALPPNWELTPGRGWLRYNVDNYHSLVALYNFELKLYRQKNITESYKRTAYTRDGEEAAAKSNLEIRNKLWLPRIEAAMKEGPTFFAFGNGHLAGWSGIISLLRRNGYTVKPIMYP